MQLTCHAALHACLDYASTGLNNFVGSWRLAAGRVSETKLNVLCELGKIIIISNNGESRNAFFMGGGWFKAQRMKGKTGFSAWIWPILVKIIRFWHNNSCSPVEVVY